MDNLFFLFDEFSNNINETSLFLLSSEDASEFISWFLVGDNRVNIDQSESNKIITSDFVLVHHGHLHCTPILFVHTVDLEVEGLIEDGVLISILVDLSLELLIR